MSTSTSRATSPERIITDIMLVEPELKMLGVQSLVLFGSVARGDDTVQSDVDVAVAMMPPTDDLAPRFVASRFLTMWLGRQVDMTGLPMNPRLAKFASEDAIKVF